MKKIYYLLLLPLFSLVSCDDDNEVIDMQHNDPVVTITEISPEQGYAGDQLSITGTDFGAAKEFMKVFIGENEAKIISCTDKKIVIEVPDNATTGKISVTLLGEKIASNLMYKVLGKPSVETMNPLWGFVGDEITFGGSSLGSKAEDIQLFFGKSATKATVASWAEDAFVVVVPEDATSGKITLNISTQKNVNTPDEFTVRQHATLTEISPVEAYKGSALTIKGTNFGTDKDAVIVLFGDKAGEVLSCTEEAIEVKVPMDAAEGAIKVTVETPYEQVEGDLDFTVTATPVVADNGISPLSGYIGSEVTVTGTKMPANKDDMVIKFGETVADIESYSVTSGNGIVKVKVPAGLSEGNVALTFTIAGLEIASKTFNVLPTPVVTTFDSKIVKIGQDITLTGTGFVTNVNDVNVSFDGQVVNPSSISSTSMTVKVPVGFAGGKLSVTFKGIPAAEVGNLNVLTVGDITGDVLKNYAQPFERNEATAGEWATAKDWSWSTNFTGGIQYPSKGGNPAESIISLSKWGQQDFNSKLYQAIKLPIGKYKASLTVVGCGSNSGRFGSYFIISKGQAIGDIPDLGDPNAWNSTIPEAIISYFKITNRKTEGADAGGYTIDLEFDLTGEENDIIVGFVSQLDKQTWVSVSAIKLELVQ